MLRSIVFSGVREGMTRAKSSGRRIRVKRGGRRAQAALK